MADTFTAHYNLTKPQIGGDPDTWGNLLNANFDTIDSQLYTASTYAVPLAGGSMTGNLSITETTATAQLALSASAGQYRQLLFSTAGVPRWVLLTDNAAESGSNAGSNLALLGYSDAGAAITTPISINRATGVTTFGARPVFGAATPWDSANLTPGNYALLTGATFTGAVSITETASTNALTITNTSAAGGVLRLVGDGSTTPGKVMRARAGNLEFVNDNNSAVISTLSDAGVWAFPARPTFAGNTPWDSGNLNPGNYALLTGATFTGTSGVTTSGSTTTLSLIDTGVNGCNLRLSGNGSTTPNKTIRAQGGNLEFINSAYSAVVAHMDDTGHWFGADFSASSDMRLKTGIRKLRRGLDELKRMQPVEYVKAGKEEIGFIAQDAQMVIPEAVDVNPEGFLTLSYGQVTALIASAVLELEHRMTVAGI